MCNTLLVAESKFNELNNFMCRSSYTYRQRIALSQQCVVKLECHHSISRCSYFSDSNFCQTIRSLDNFRGSCYIMLSNEDCVRADR